MSTSAKGPSLWAEIQSRALVFSESMPGADHLALVTMVQLDGDICLSIDSRALALEPSELEALLATHIEHVRRELAERLATVRKRIRWSSLGLGSVSTLVSAGYMIASDDSVGRWTQVLPALESELVAAGLDYGLVVGLGVLASVAARIVLRRQFRKFVRPTLTPDEAEHQRQKLAMTAVSDPS